MLEFDSTFKDAQLQLAVLEVQLGNYAAAKRALATFRFPAEKHDYVTMLSAFIDTRSGHPPTVMPNLRPRERVHFDTGIAAALCLALGRRDDALTWIRLGIKHEGTMTRKMLAIDPFLEPLQTDPRFRALIS